MPKFNKNLHFFFTLIISLTLSHCASAILKASIYYERSKGDIEVKKISINKFDIVYTEAGSGETLLLLHGFGGDKDNWTRMTPFLYKKYRIIAPDLPGFGESSRISEENYSVGLQIQRIKEFKDKLGLGKIHLAGNSMGGAISAAYTLKYPEDVISLTLIDSAGVTSPTKSELTLELEKGNNPLLVKDAKDFDRLMNFNFYKKPYIPDGIKGYFAERAVKNRDFNQKIFSDIRGEPNLVEPNLAKIKTPTLIVWGDKDRVIHPDSAFVFKKGIPDSKIYMLKDCGHIPQLERPQEVASVVQEFIKGYTDNISK